MDSIFDHSTYSTVLERINSLEESTQPVWGKMSVSQMLAHNVIPFDIVLEKRPPIGKPNFIMKLLFKKMMYNDKPFKRSLPTPGPFNIESSKDFNTEKQQLISVVNEVYTQKDKDKWPTHPMFGEFTSLQTGQLLFKHLDHHLRQFGV